MYSDYKQRYHGVITAIAHRTGVECGGSEVECRDSQSRGPGFESPLLPFRSLGIFVLFTTHQSSVGCINEYLAIRGGGNVSD